jgi:thiol-disulfide isomerase/thioredoxin
VRFTFDALVLGPFVLEWGRLGAILGVLVFTSLVGRLKQPRLERTAWMSLGIGFIVARGVFALRNWEASVQDGWLTLLDVRVGGWDVLTGLAVGTLALLWQVRGQGLRMLPAALAGLTLLFAPGVVKALVPTPSSRLEPEVVVYRYGANGQLEKMRWADLPERALINVWATWCTPCRLEMPWFAALARAGHPVYLLNDGEGQRDVERFLADHDLQDTPVLLDFANAREALNITGIPTTFEVIDRRITKRHLGPMNRAQLEAWLKALESR